MVNRRDFIAGSCAVAGAAALPVALLPKPPKCRYWAHFYKSKNSYCHYSGPRNDYEKTKAHMEANGFREVAMGWDYK